jgi:S-adenosylmethionine:tRNA ribosyltransferase-isomerase
MQLSDFDYQLPTESIAQSPAIPRESAKLLVVSQNSDALAHKHICDFPDLLLPTDILVINNTKVFRARLHGTREKDNRRVELFLIRPQGAYWECISKPGKKLTEGVVIHFGLNFSCRVVSKKDDGSILVDFQLPFEQVIDEANRVGDIPVPPYIKHQPKNDEYQTVYAKYVGSVAAPTAGFHITTKLLNIIKKKGVTICEITLHVGLGTFQPVRTEKIEDHPMHAEWVHIPESVAQTIENAKSQGRRIVAIGTTSVRALEGVAKLHSNHITAYTGDINIFITPGFQFSVIDALLTNFHLPKSTLLMLVSALAGRERIFAAYSEALTHNYRFYSFGDAMFIHP